MILVVAEAASGELRCVRGDRAVEFAVDHFRATGDVIIGEDIPQLASEAVDLVGYGRVRQTILDQTHT